MEYKKKEYSAIIQRIAEPRMFIQVLMGPRQVGKSTLISQVMEATDIPHSFFSADTVDENDGEWIVRSWESARQTMNLHGSSEYLLVIDEIQKISNWSEYVKREWDKDSMSRLNMKVVLLGSSRLLLRKGLTESLTGRYELIRIGHWTYAEMHDAFGFSLDQWMYFGGYPGGARLVSDERRWRKYVKDSLVAPSIEKDVIMTSRIYKPALMTQMFELGCSYSDELLSLTKMLGQLQDAGNVTTLQSYLNVLKQCNLLAGLQKYAVDDTRKYKSVPKLQVYNNALLTAHHHTTFETTRIDTKLWGRWVESAVGVHLLNQAENEEYSVYYWRDHDDEVDFIVNRGGKVTAIEVKSGRRGMNSGLPVFNGKFHPDKSIVVGTDGISLIDFFTFNIIDILA